MKIDLADKTAVVTGSTAGIGFAIAKGLAQAGATVVMNGRTAPAVYKAVAALKGFAVRGVADILVNNVGIYGPQDFFDIPDAK